MFESQVLIPVELLSYQKVHKLSFYIGILTFISGFLGSWIMCFTLDDNDYIVIYTLLILSVMTVIQLVQLCYTHSNQFDKSNCKLFIGWVVPILIDTSKLVCIIILSTYNINFLYLLILCFPLICVYHFFHFITFFT